MKKLLYSVGFSLLVSVISVTSLWSQTRHHPTLAEFKKLRHGHENMLPAPSMASRELNFSREGLPRPAYEAFKHSAVIGRNASVPRPESLCDDGYYWMGGPAWTADSDGVSTVWAAGGNLYFAGASDTAHPVEMWWGDIGLRVRIHNGFAYIFSYYYTYVFDVSSPTMPSFVSYGPGYYFGFMDAVPSPNDTHLLLTDWFNGDFWGWDLGTMTMSWEIRNPNSGWYVAMHVVDEKEVVILGDLDAGTFDFYYVGGADCIDPVFLGQFTDPDNNTGLIFYHQNLLYGLFEPWQFYNYWIFNSSPDNTTWLSIHNVPDVLNPGNNFYVGPYSLPGIDTTAMKDAGEYMLTIHYQNEANLWTPMFDTNEGSVSFSVAGDSATFDGVFSGGYGLAACGQGGISRWDDSFTETGKLWTGGYAQDLAAWGNYLFVPSGTAGLAILDNTDPSMPVTYGHLEPDNINFEQVTHVAVSSGGNFCYISDGSGSVWVVDISNKAAPFVVAPASPYTASAGTVRKLSAAGDFLAVGTDASLDLVDATSNPAAPVTLDTRTIAGGVTGIAQFNHSACPGQSFIGVTSSDSFHTFFLNGGTFSDDSSLGGFTDLAGVAVTNDVAYAIDAVGGIHPVRMFPPVPFALSTAGTTTLTLGWSWGSDPFPPMITSVSASTLAAAGDHLTSGYPAVFLVDIGTNPLAPALLPSGQQGIMPFNHLSGMISSGGMVYYATDYFGTGALVVKPDYDLPTIQAGYPSVSPVIPDIPGTPNGMDPSGGWLNGQVTLTAKVMDSTTAITRVVFKFFDGTMLRTVATLAGSTPAGTVGTYTYSWDTRKWAYGTGEGYIRVEVTDSGCNTTMAQSPLEYAINKPPTFELLWDVGCNEPPVGSSCDPAIPWIVCGNLDLWIWGRTSVYNEANNPLDPQDDISQIAYNFDKGAAGPWTLFDIPLDAPNPMWISMNTAALSEGNHTLYVRVTDDCGLQSMQDIHGISSWTFTVHNRGPQIYLTSPLAGASVGGDSVLISAKPYNELGPIEITMVNFYIDPSDLNDPLTGTLIGSTAVKNGSGEYSIDWDATGFPLGSHIIIAAAWEDSACCPGPYKSPLSIFNLVVVEEIPPEIATGSSEADAQGWSEDKTTQSWPSEPTATGGYRLYRGTLSQLPSLLTTENDSCLKYDGAGTSVDLSADDPSGVEGSLYWYLVTAYNGAGEGPAGNGTTGSRIVNSTGTCIP